MIVYLRNHQQEDGGWGSHIECASTMFGTVLSYVALRLLGEPAEAEYLAQARSFMHTHGGALYAPSWAKFWLALIGVYEWEGINSIPAEMWVLPKWVPLHPSQFWCHCRMIYLPMCYLYCKRVTPNVSQDPVLLALRREIYRESDIYEKIDWEGHRQSCAAIDEYTPLNPVIKVAQDILSLYERILPYFPPLRMFRDYSLKFVLEYIHAEDKQTNYVDIGPVSKALNMLCVFDACGAQSEAFQRHIARVDDYIWVAEDGVKMQGYNGSQCWDTAFTVRAMVEAGLAEQFPECSRKVYAFLDRSQIRRNEDNMERYFRHPSKGGWPFSTGAHGWPISDCTSEALKGVLAIHQHDAHAEVPLVPADQRISDDRLCDACDVLLSYQNTDGGWASYENNRGARWYELFNPSSVFADIMIDYSYVECSSASIAALKDFTTAVPHYRQEEVRRAIAIGRDFLLSIQRPDGSWYGSWGNCFTYGTWFGIEGLVCAGAPVHSEGVRKAVQFLLSKQNVNGGWGESHLACINKAYPKDGLGQVRKSSQWLHLDRRAGCMIATPRSRLYLR
jgi:squalene/oxidosqualene cyclase-like protein